MNDIINMEKFKQGLIFGDIEYDGMRPSDIDLVMEARDECWIIAEIKTEGKEVPTGQRLMLERLYNDLEKSGKPVLCVVANHNHPVDEDIDAANCIIEKAWNGKRWVKAKRKATLKYAVDWFLEKNLPT